MDTMDLYAFDSFEPAIKRTNDLLFKPFRLKFWLMLALVVFIMGFRFNFRGSGNFGGEKGGNNLVLGNLWDFIGNNIELVAAAIGVVILIAFVIGYIRMIFQFIFLESVLNSRIEFREGIVRHMDRAMRVFLFEVAIGLIFMLCMALPFGAIYWGYGFAALPVMIVALIATIFLLMIPMIIITSFTESFVIPYMYTGRGLTDGWKRLITVLRANISETAAYIIANIILNIMGGILGIAIFIATLIVLLMPALALLIIFIVVGAIASASGLFTGTLMWAAITVAAAAILIFILTAAYVLTLTGLPIPVFFRFYTLIFLSKMDKEFEIPKPENANGI